jgi:ABC-2 type transport system ATP-binding protein
VGREPIESRVGGHPMSVVVVEGLRKAYHGVAAVDDVSFSVQAGTIFALLGPNGAGKTTTLEVLEGFRERDGGRVEVLGCDPGDRSRGRWLREQIGLVLQDIAVEPYLTVGETIARNAGYYPDPRGVDEVVELVGLAGHARRKVKDLSGGQKRRLDLALGIVGNPRLLFLDEPTTGFDPSARRQAWQVVKDLRASGTTILLTTHYMDEAQELADEIAVMAAGKVVACGPPARIGGRDVALTSIGFQLPAGTDLADLPLPDARLSDEGMVLAQVAEPTAVLHELTGWALRRGVLLARLSVQQPSLEDVYLSLTGTGSDEPVTAPPHRRQPRRRTAGRRA